MALRTIFRVQGYVVRDRRLNPASHYDFESAVAAEEAGIELSRSMDGVLVYAQDCDPPNEIWGEPVVFAAHGRTPRVEF